MYAAATVLETGTAALQLTIDAVSLSDSIYPGRLPSRVIPSDT